VFPLWLREALITDDEDAMVMIRFACVVNCKEQKVKFQIVKEKKRGSRGGTL
jgi:hypothetical protein